MVRCYAISLDTASNPFRFGALALDEAFTNREREIAELKADIANGQDVVVFAPRRYGKSSLMWRVAQELVRRRVLVASVDLMTTPTVAKLAEKLARTIHEDVASTQGEGARPPADLQLAAGQADRQRRSRHGQAVLRLRRRLSPRRTCARRSSTCWRCPASSAPSASAAWR